MHSKILNCCNKEAVVGLFVKTSHTAGPYPAILKMRYLSQGIMNGHQTNKTSNGVCLLEKLIRLIYYLTD